MSAFIRVEGKLIPVAQVRGVEERSGGAAVRVLHSDGYTEGEFAEVVETIPNTNPNLVLLETVEEPDGTTSLEEWPVIAWRVEQLTGGLAAGVLDYATTVTPITGRSLGGHDFALLDRRTGHVVQHSSAPDGERWFRTRESFIGSLDDEQGAPGAVQVKADAPAPRPVLVSQQPARDLDRKFHSAAQRCLEAGGPELVSRVLRKFRVAKVSDVPPSAYETARTAFVVATKKAERKGAR